MLEFFRLMTEGMTARDWVCGTIATLLLVVLFGICGGIETGAIW